MDSYRLTRRWKRRSSTLLHAFSVFRQQHYPGTVVRPFHGLGDESVFRRGLVARRPAERVPDRGDAGRRHALDDEGMERIERPARAQLDDALFEACWAEGAALTTEQAIADALDGAEVPA